MAFPKYKLAFFAAIALSAATTTMLAANEQDFDGKQKVPLQPATIQQLQFIHTTLKKIGATNKLLKGAVAPVLVLCGIGLDRVFPDAFELLRLMTGALQALCAAVLAPGLPTVLKAIDPALISTVEGCIPQLVNCILTEPNFLVKGLLSCIIAMVCCVF